MEKLFRNQRRTERIHFSCYLNLAFICLFILCQAAHQPKQLEAES